MNINNGEQERIPKLIWRAWKNTDQMFFFSFSLNLTVKKSSSSSEINDNKRLTTNSSWLMMMVIWLRLWRRCPAEKNYSVGWKKAMSLKTRATKQRNPRRAAPEAAALFSHWMTSQPEIAVSRIMTLHMARIWSPRAFMGPSRRMDFAFFWVEPTEISRPKSATLTNIWDAACATFPWKDLLGSPSFRKTFSFSKY